MITIANDRILDYYLQPGPMTTAGDHAATFRDLPADVASLVNIVQGLLLHEHWAPYYGQRLSDERRRESHIRPAASMLDRLLANDGMPATHGRPLENRVVGTCRDFTVLLVAMLRATGTPARARCGFGAYFMPGTFEDHWVCEYWNEEDQRWMLVDAQIDTFQRDLMQLDFEPLDVPRDRFIVAGDAWAQCRAGESDPATFGIRELRGLWFIAGNVIRDLAALNNMEMLPWDVWGAMLEPDDQIDDQLALFDQIATVTFRPDTNFTALVELYADEQLRVPATVFNALLNHPETI